MDDRNNPPSGNRLRAIRSNLTGSILTRTDSTISNIRGPGRILGAAMSASGRRIESIASRVARSMGFGPYAVLRDILALLHERHERVCFPSSKPLKSHIRRSSLNVDVLISHLVDLSWTLCVRCRHPFIVNSEVEKQCAQLLAELLKYTRYVCAVNTGG